MKKLKLFEEHSWDVFNNKPVKNYGEYFPLLNLIKGQRVVYYGAPCEVVDRSEYIVILRLVKDPEKEFKVNQTMFKNKGYIARPV